MTLENMGGNDPSYGKRGVFWDREWDDKPIRPENFRRVKEEKQRIKAQIKKLIRKTVP